MQLFFHAACCATRAPPPPPPRVTQNAASTNNKRALFPNDNTCGTRGTHSTKKRVSYSVLFCFLCIVGLTHHHTNARTAHTTCFDRRGFTCSYAASPAPSCRESSPPAATAPPPTSRSVIPAPPRHDIDLRRRRRQRAWLQNTMRSRRCPPSTRCRTCGRNPAAWGASSGL